jgi:hypothetical protein
MGGDGDTHRSGRIINIISSSSSGRIVLAIIVITVI